MPNSLLRFSPISGGHGNGDCLVLGARAPAGVWVAHQGKKIIVQKKLQGAKRGEQAREVP